MLLLPQAQERCAAMEKSALMESRMQRPDSAAIEANTKKSDAATGSAAVEADTKKSADGKSKVAAGVAAVKTDVNTNKSADGKLDAATVSAAVKTEKNAVDNTSAAGKSDAVAAVKSEKSADNTSDGDSLWDQSDDNSAWSGITGNREESHASKRRRLSRERVARERTSSDDEVVEITPEQNTENLRQKRKAKREARKPEIV